VAAAVEPIREMDNLVVLVALLAVIQVQLLVLELLDKVMQAGHNK